MSSVCGVVSVPCLAVSMPCCPHVCPHGERGLGLGARCTGPMCVCVRVCLRVCVCAHRAVFSEDGKTVSITIDKKRPLNNYLSTAINNSKLYQKGGWPYLLQRQPIKACSGQSCVILC